MYYLGHGFRDAGIRKSKAANYSGIPLSTGTIQKPGEGTAYMA